MKPIKLNTQFNSDSERVQILAEFIINRFISCPNGWTFDPFTLTHLDIDSIAKKNSQLYAVSQEGHEAQFIGQPVTKDIERWVIENYGDLCVWGNFIGGWKYQGRSYLDITNYTYGQEYSLSLAIQENQLAIYHPATGKCIPVLHDYPDVG